LKRKASGGFCILKKKNQRQFPARAKLAQMESSRPGMLQRLVQAQGVAVILFQIEKNIR
jgi:hypothetical protein